MTAKGIPTGFSQSTAKLGQASALLRRALPSTTLPCSPANPTRVLVTGAGGFLGVHLLADLANHRIEKVYGLVRDIERAKQQWARYALPEPLLAKIEWVQGDLNEINYQALPSVDVVVHGAARIHGLKSLTQMWPDNVAATVTLLRHCLETGTALQLVSTLSVFVSSNQSGLHLPVPLLESEQIALHGGYAQSKYVSEKLALDCGAAVHRLGLLTGATLQGTAPANDFFLKFIDAMRVLGIHPAEYEPAWVDLTPVDHASSGLAQAVVQGVPCGTITHIAHQRSLGLAEVLQALNTCPVPKAEFLDQLRAFPALTRVLLHYAFFKSESLLTMPQYFNIDLFQSTGHTYAARHEVALAPEELLARYLARHMAAQPGEVVPCL